MFVRPREEAYNHFVTVFRFASPVTTDLDVTRYPIIIRFHVYRMTAPAKRAGDGLDAPLDDLHDFSFKGCLTLTTSPRHPPGKRNHRYQITMETRVKEVGSDHNLGIGPGRSDNPQTPFRNGEQPDGPTANGGPGLFAGLTIRPDIPDSASLIKFNDAAPPQVIDQLTKRMILITILYVQVPGKFFHADPGARVLRQKGQHAFFQGCDSRSPQKENR
jgi:hypothetical protein